MALPYDNTDLAGLNRARTHSVCKRPTSDGHKCQGRMGQIPKWWFMLDGGRYLLGPQILTAGRPQNVPFTGPERVLYLADGLIEEDDRAERYILAQHARDNIEHGYTPR